MIKIPGTYYTKEQLYDDLKVDNISVVNFSGSDKWSEIGTEYVKKKQYLKALAWYLLSASDNNSYGQNNVGRTYHCGWGIPINYLCALKWYLKSARQNSCKHCYKNIGELFENGQGVPLDKNRALEWYCHYEDDTLKKSLKKQGYHRSRRNKGKTLTQLVKETEAILEAEKKKLEKRMYKTQEEIEQLKITYILADDKANSWRDILILTSEDKQHNTESMNVFTVNHENEMLGLKNKIQLLRHEKNQFGAQVKQLQLFTQEKFQLEIQIREKDNTIDSLERDIKSFQHGNATLENQIQDKDSKITSLERKNQELNMKNSHSEHEIKEKSNRTMSLQAENQSLQRKKTKFEYQIKNKDNKINLLESENQSLKLERSSLEHQIETKDRKISSLENEKRSNDSSSPQQTQSLNSLKEAKQVMEQDKMQIINEMEQLTASQANLEQLLKSKEDTIILLNRENQNLVATNQTLLIANQGTQQGNKDMIDTLRSLLQAKSNEMDLQKQNMELLLANEKRKNDALEQENGSLKKERTQNQTSIQHTNTLHSSIYPANVGTNHNNSDSNHSQDGINYDAEYGDAEESGDGDDDVNYDTPSEDGDS